MIGKIYLKRIGGYDPALGKSVVDPTLESRREGEMSEPLGAAEVNILEAGQDVRALAAEVRRLQAQRQRLQAELAEARAEIERWKDFRAGQIDQEAKNALDYSLLCRDLAEARTVAATILHYTNTDIRGQLAPVIAANPWLETTSLLEGEPDNH